jgi:hypothetical protein
MRSNRRDLSLCRTLYFLCGRLVGLVVFAATAWPLASKAMGSGAPQEQPCEFSGQRAAGARTSSVVDMPMDELVRKVPALKKLRPATSEQPLAPILQKVGKNVAALVRNFPNVTSREEVLEQRLSGAGGVHDEAYQEFRYLSLPRSDKGDVGFVEYRTDSKARPTEPRGLYNGYLVTKGFVSLPLYFYPEYQALSRFRYLGREVLDKHNTEVVAFAQTPSTKIGGEFSVNGRSVHVLSQGVAWIDPADNQIVRLRTEVLTPVPEIGLRSQSTQIKFATVRFSGAGLRLWLPREVEVETEWCGTFFRNVHSYSDFKLFTVDTRQRQQHAPASR